MNERCVLSVNVAAYNVEKYIDSVLQPFADNYFDNRIEVLIVSDGSTDGTDAIAQQYVDQYPKIFKLIKKDNGGWGSTLNTGISVAKGKYFKQLDGDDFFNRDNFKEFIDFLEQCNEDIVLTPFEKFDDVTGDIIEVERFNDSMRECIFPSKLEDVMMHCNRIMFMHAICVKRELLVKNHINIEEKCYYTDIEFVIKVNACAKTVNYFDKPIYMYRVGVNGQSVSIAGFEKHHKEHERVVFKLAAFYLDCTDRLIVREAIISRIGEMIYAQFVIYLTISNSKQALRNLKEFDSKVKNMYPELYEKTNTIKKVAALRKTNFGLYYPLRVYLKAKQK